MKKFYYVISEEKGGKHFAFADAIANCNNLITFFKNRYPNATIIHACESRREAENIAIEWNRTYQKNGMYLFD